MPFLALIPSVIMKIFHIHKKCICIFMPFEEVSDIKILKPLS